jgi:hypothetical protein
VRATRKIAGAFPVPARMREYQRNATGRDVQRKGERREADHLGAWVPPPPPSPPPPPVPSFQYYPHVLG